MESLVIKNFKNLANLTTPPLAQVNLITGRNNVGKSTLLEALSIYASNGNIWAIHELLRQRGWNNFNNEVGKKESYASLFYNYQMNMSNESCISIGDITIRLVKFCDVTITHKEGGVTTSRIVARTPPEVSEPYEWIEGLEITHDSASIIHSIQSAIIRSSGEQRIQQQYVRTNDLTRDVNGNLWDRVVMTDKEKTVITALQIAEPRIEAISFIIDPDDSAKRIPVVKLKGDNSRHRLNSMGDGINRIFTLVLGMVNCDNGFFLVDEFENGLHYTTQTRLWQIIFQLAQELNVQVFATTHSSDCIHSFCSILETNKVTNGKMIRLEQKEHDIIAVAYTAEEMIYGVENRIEMR